MPDQITIEKPRPATPYERLGGLPTLQRITTQFYDLMESDPAYAELRAMHSADLSHMRGALAGFLAGWTGGPRDWFEANPGRCMMSIHKNFPIEADTARQWADAMGRAINETIGESDPEIAKVMTNVLEQMATGMAP